MRQFSGGINGGAEGLIHFQKVAAAMARKGLLGCPLVHIDIDQENMLGLIEWSSIQQ